MTCILSVTLGTENDVAVLTADNFSIPPLTKRD